jgi:hypothetical protein
MYLNYSNLFPISDDVTKLSANMLAEKKTVLICHSFLEKINLLSCENLTKCYISKNRNVIHV